MAMPWQPLLEGDWKDRAEQAVRAILADLEAPRRGAASDPSLAGGAAGLAVLHGYLAQGRRESGHAASARHYLHNAIGAMADGPCLPSLYSGLTGVGWALAHLRDCLPGLDDEDDLAAIDEVLLSHLDPSLWQEDYDLINGLVGFGVYALARLPQPAAVECLERVVGHLAATAEHRPEGVTWWTNPAWLPAESRERHPHGYHNLGLAHGVPGVIALLGQVCAAAVAVDRARPLLLGAVRWLLAQRRPGGFSHWVTTPSTAHPARLAWCYGDPGVAAVLLGAARCIADPAWEREARGIARRAAGRPPDQAGVGDVGLCHGAGGLGHVFNRLFQATGDDRLADAARFWFARALELRRPGRGIGGFEAWEQDDDKVCWVADPGLLRGSVGIALALLAATTATEPAWDQMLLVAIPPATAC
jgi:hypothetical protein